MQKKLERTNVLKFRWCLEFCHCMYMCKFPWEFKKVSMDMHIVFTEWHLLVEKCLPWKVLLILGIWTYNFQSLRIPNCFNSVLLIFQGCWENRCYMFGKLRAENSQNVVRHFLDVWHLHTATTQCLKSLLYSVMTLFVQLKAKGQKMMANNNKTTH